MSQLDAISATKAVKERLLDFCRSDHYVTDPQLDGICQFIWGGKPRNGGLAGDLWVEAAFPPRGSGKTMQDHVDEGEGLIGKELAELLDTNKAFQLDWELREIQSQSVRAARAADSSEAKPAIVVSAGTGAGKTESFLFPMLDELMRNPGSPKNGVSAIILYPMNALVTDQVERLTNWLRGQTKLKIFHFTGETPEDHRAAQYVGYPQVADCCFRTRQQARGLESEDGRAISESERGNQPDVIVTNYSMLEYMLCRPQDAVFFGKNLRHVVLDEAHLYTGNLAAEITLLLRRLANKCDVDVSKINHYATSATLVEGTESEQEAALGKFASQVFSKPVGDVKVILGKKTEPLVDVPVTTEAATSPHPEKPWPSLPGIEEVENRDRLVVSDDGQWNTWLEALQELLPELDSKWDEPKEICRFLQQKLPNLDVFRHLYHLLYEKRIQPLEELSERLWKDGGEQACEATRRLLQAGAIARIDASLSPLLPNRIHWSIRAPGGLFFSFAHEHSPHEHQIYKVNGIPLGYFYSPGYYSRPEEDITHPLLVMRDSRSGQWFLTGMVKSARLVVSEEALPKSKERLESLLERLSFFRLDAANLGEAGSFIEFDPQSGKIGEPGGIHLQEVKFSESEAKSLKPMGSDSRLQLSVIAEGALAEMPPYPGDSKRWKPAEGRRLLVFSDSRREAATLGPSLTGNHERQLFRALVVEGLQALGEEGSEDLDKKIKDLKETLEKLPEVVRPVIQNEIDSLTGRKHSAETGLSPENFVNALKQSPRVEEFFDRQEGERHSSGNWSQAIYERNRDAVRNSLSHRLSQELARRTLWPDLNLESAGFLELVYPNIENLALPAEFLGQLPSAQFRENLQKSFPDFLGMILDDIRDRGGITLGDDDLDASYGIGGGYIGKWASQETRYKYKLFPLITASSTTYVASFTQLYLRQAGMNEEEAASQWKPLLEAIHGLLYDAHQKKRVDWLQFDQRQAEEGKTTWAFRLRFDKLRIRQPLELYQCADTGQVWPRSALGCHLRSFRPSLQPISRDQLGKNPRIARVHREWGESTVFKYGLWAEEHSAQIGAKENRRLQDLFKSGIRNVLSSTTTLELGIDIGGLNGVMMGNIPPGKASYLQRAGRAGRRADGSSLVISYSRNTPYERKVFEDFGAYLESPLREPVVFLDRSDLVRRHIHSLLFSDFFIKAYGSGATRGAMEAFGNMGTFANAPQTSYWGAGDPKPTTQGRDAQTDVADDFTWGTKGSSLADFFDNYLDEMSENLDERLSEGIRKLSRDTGLDAESEDSQKDLIGALKSRVHRCVKAWFDNYNDLLDQWQAAPSDGGRREKNFANALHYQLKQLFGMRLIEAFSDAMLLPRYGFPIGLSELRVNPGSKDSGSVSEEFRLNRSASQAVTEYAPGSKVLVGAKIVHSQGILKSWTGDDIPSEGMGLRAWYRWNERNGKFQYQYVRFDDKGDEAQAEYSRQGEMLFVKHGFTTAASEKPTYGGSPERTGKNLTICRPPEEDGMITPYADFFGIPGVIARLNVGGELLAMNSGNYEQGFAVCTKCGYASSEVAGNQSGMNTGRVGLPKGFEWHSPIHEENEYKTCWKKEETFILRHLHLSARQVCDFLELELPLVPGSSTDRKQIANTVGQALRMSGARLLNIDSRELSLLKPTTGKLTRISICDSLAGGAGHVRDLSAMAPAWWADAISMISGGSVTQVTLGLLTADVPVREGLPDLCIESTRLYINRLEQGILEQLPEIGDESNPPDFSGILKK